MPDIDSIPEALHSAMDPYHWTYDNIPLQNLLDKVALVNSAVDNNSQVLRDAAGTQGTVANRLDQSIDEDGTLLVDAIDGAGHSIAMHVDGSDTLSGDEISIISDLGYTVTNPVGFVRMLEAERDKLALIADEATAIKLQVDTAAPSTTVLFNDQTVRIQDTSTIVWSVESPNKIKANMVFPADAAHQHVYGVDPVHESLSEPDYQNYKVNSSSTAFKEDSLRVYVNGIRLNPDDSVYVYTGSNPGGTWTLTKYTPDHEEGTFALNRSIDEDDIIKIDYDLALV